jgi:hypothetical protein
MPRPMRSDLAARLLVPAPRAHHEGVVDGDAPDLVDLLRPQLVVIDEVARHVLGGAGRREGARHPEDDDALALRELPHVEVVGADGAAGCFLLDELGQGALGQPVANLDRHERSSSGGEVYGRGLAPGRAQVSPSVPGPPTPSQCTIGGEEAGPDPRAVTPSPRARSPCALGHPGRPPGRLRVDRRQRRARPDRAHRNRSFDHLFDTTSVIKFITRRFALEPLPGVREKAGDLTNAFAF